MCRMNKLRIIPGNSRLLLSKGKEALGRARKAPAEGSGSETGQVPEVFSSLVAASAPVASPRLSYLHEQDFGSLLLPAPRTVAGTSETLRGYSAG